MANSAAYTQGVKDGQKNPSAQAATPAQMPNAAVRQDYNNGLKQGQKK